ncbi:MAG: hypothetical protein IPP27_15165 [Bacteroidetes bacterium]|nr:hypothetical protein [Bacteroidota bacterium]
MTYKPNKAFRGDWRLYTELSLAFNLGRGNDDVDLMEEVVEPVESSVRHCHAL